MRHTATAFATVLSFTAAYFLYAENMDSRRIESAVHAAERTRDHLESEIAVLRADRAYLARPQRIEPLARNLGMEPPTSSARTTLEAVLNEPANTPPRKTP